MQTINLKEYYTPSQVAEAISVTPTRIIQIIAEGKLKGRKISDRFWLVEKQSADEYIAAVTRIKRG